MIAREYSTPRRPRLDDERPSALAYWGTGATCLGFLILVFWLARMNF